jgi:Protein of unknown function (DUF1553)/Protein of unknown function (DUF1549)/Concanavalin A-like lectin/glucanases superfamily/Planctomycete cytochrome C
LPTIPGRCRYRACVRLLLLLVVQASTVAWSGSAAPAHGAEPARKVDFNFQVRPILSDKCFNCHGPDARQRKAGLRLDTKEGAFGINKSGGRAIVAGQLDDSDLIARITATDESERMPPKSLGRSLSMEEISLLKQWIEQGADWKPHWSFLPPDAAALPDVKSQAWPRNPLDSFVLARLDTEHLTPAAEASKERLIRRVTFDLTGLPPTLAEIDAFLTDLAPNAYDRLVDRLLASPRFGERMAVDWLDLARYADTYGYQSDVYRAMWPWRDWVIHAFNANLPYDQFITWQLAGDLLPRPTRAQVLATAFNRHHRQTNEGGSIEEEFRVEYVSDRTNTFATAFLGLTFECARCHSHKYDPITQKEYYQLFSFFNSIDESGLYSHFTSAVPTPAISLTSPGQDQAIATMEARIKAAEAELDRSRHELQPAFDAWLKSPKRAPVVAGLIGDFPLDDLNGGKVANRVDPQKLGQASENPEIVEGRIGKALRFSGENNVALPLGNFDRFQPFAVSLWINTPDTKDRAVIIHRSMAWTDAGSRGYQLLIEDGKLSAGLIHFWPGNAIGIRAAEPLSLNQWAQVTITYDGSSRASGLALYVNGCRALCKVVRDRLTKNITGGGNDQLTVGQRFRDRGFKNGLVDEIKVFDRELTPLEVAQLYDGHALAQALSLNPAKLTDSQRNDLFAYYLATVDSRYTARLAALKNLRQERSVLVDPVAEIMVMKEMPRPRPTYLLKRGAYDAPADRVDPGTPASLPPFESSWPRNRLGLAQWLTSSQHPLTARVAVNRWWQALFGRGIVATPEDFGSQGQLPSHPGLLDWLARKLINSGWNVKHIIRLIVTSATYRQSSDTSAELLARDPENILLARGPRFRLPAEMIRDGALAASSTLVDTIGGQPVKPFQPPGLWEEKSGLSYQRDAGAGSHRRSLYTFWKRTSPPPAMLTFDATTREVCAVKRQSTATPLQALVLLNDPQYVEAAGALAQRAIKEGGSNLADRITFVVRTLVGRRPDPRELTTLEALYHDQYDEFRGGHSDPQKLFAVGDAPLDAALDPAERAALTVMVQALLNYDETVMKR